MFPQSVQRNTGKALSHIQKSFKVYFSYDELYVYLQLIKSRLTGSYVNDTVSNELIIECRRA
jgi:hypothetical protein